jgi:hypothetical protein
VHALLIVMSTMNNWFVCIYVFRSKSVEAGDSVEVENILKELSILQDSYRERDERLKNDIGGVCVVR